MNRREFLPLALLAVPEITAPSTADERLTAAVDAWTQAQAVLADQRATFEAVTRQLQTSRGMATHRLRALVETREAAKAEVEAGERAVAECEARISQAARLRDAP